MRDMKDSGIEWIGEIPQDWLIVRIKMHFVILSGSGFKESIQGIENGDYPVCKASDISVEGKEITFAKNYITKQQAKAEGFKVVPQGSVIFPKIGEAMKKNSRKLTCIECCLDNNCQALVPIDYNSNYAYYLFLCIDSAWFDNAGTIPCINNQRLYNFAIPKPLAKEQHRIADFLDRKCAEIDALTADIQTQIDTLEQYKRSVITEAVTKGLDPNAEMKDSGIEWCPRIPAQWNYTNPKGLFSLRNDRAFPGDKQLTASQEYGIVFQDEYMKLTGNKIVTVEKDFSILKHVEPDDFVISMRSFQGGLEYSEKKGCISSAYVMLIPNKKYVYAPFYRWFFKSSKYINAIQSTSNLVRDGQAMRYANFVQVPLFIIPMEEQKHIAAYLNEKIGEIDTILKDKKEQLSVLADYKKSLIYEYVTGKKEVPVS